MGEAIKNFFGTAWFLFLCACGAMYMGWLDIPKPILATWDRLNGNGHDTFAEIVAAYPANQAAFVQAVHNHRDQYRVDENEMAKGATRASRKAVVCSIVSDHTDGEWIGTVDTLSSNGDGLGVLAVKIAPHVLVKTWNNSVSDIGSNTLIPPGTPVHKVAVSLKEGDEVRFTGKFFPDETDCIEEGSLSLSGSMNSPEFIVRFETLRRFID